MNKIQFISMGMLIVFGAMSVAGCTPSISKSNSLPTTTTQALIVEKDLNPKSINDGKQAYEKTTIPEVTELTLPNVFSDYMMFEADKPIIIWGLTPFKEDIKISLFDKNDKKIREKTIRPASDNSFLTEMKGISPSFDNYKLEITSGTSTKQIKDILFGRLYLAGGQSNMDMIVRDIYKSEEVLNAATNSNIRIYNLPPNPCSDAEYSTYPSFAPVLGGLWVRGDKKVPLKNVTAVGYLFAKGIFEKINSEKNHIPVGILSTSRGGTRIDTWMSKRAVEGNTELKNEMIANKVYSNETNWISDNKPTDYIFNQSSALYNMKIAPLTNMNIAGLVWYQGETNVATSMELFTKELDAFMKDLSLQFRYKEYTLPTAIINIAAYPYEKTYARAKLITGVARVNEIFNLFANQHKDNVVSVPIYDVSLRYEDAIVNKAPIHPTDKIPVAARAVELFFGLNSKTYAPKYSSFKVDGNKITIEFENTFDGLETKNKEAVKGFRICGADRNFYIADAVIEGKNKVVLTCASVPNPVAASYAFYNINTDANLFNSKGIPVQIFRTDKNEYIHVK